VSYHVKVREPGAKRFYFLTSNGGMNALRIHAAIFASAEKAQALIDANAPDNPGWDWKVQPASKGAL
jgi:hypothetical protein